MEFSRFLCSGLSFAEVRHESQSSALSGRLDTQVTRTALESLAAVRGVAHAQQRNFARNFLRNYAS